MNRESLPIPGIIERFRLQIANQKGRLFPDGFQSEAELLEASVVRYERICDGLSNEESRWTKLRESMSEDPTIAPYVNASGGHLRQAVSLARADVEYWKCLKRSGWSTLEQRRRARAWQLVKLAGMPIIIVLLTAFLGNWIASSIQDKSFQRQRFFDAKLQRLREGQQRAVTLTSRLRSLEDMMATWEVYGGAITPRQFFTEHREEIEQIRALGLDDKGGGQVSLAAKSAQKELDSYIVCLERKAGQQRTLLSTSSCSEEFELREFESLILSFIREMNALAE